MTRAIALALFIGAPLGFVIGLLAGCDSDGTALAALCEDIAVPQDCQARAVRHRQEAVAHRPIRRENNG